MSDGNNFDFLMSLQIETGNAVQKINDVWSAMREMASKQVELKLEVSANYQNALRGLEETKLKLDEVSKAAAKAKKDAEDMGTLFETAMKKASGVSQKAAIDIQDAFNTKNVEKMTQALDALQRRAAKLGSANTEHLKGWMDDNREKLAVTNKYAPQAAGISPANMSAMKAAQADIIKAAKALAATAEGSDAQKQADRALAEAQVALKTIAISLGAEALAVEEIFDQLAGLDQEIVKIEEAAKRASSRKGGADDAKAMNLTAHVAKQYRAVLDQMLNGDSAGITSSLNAINSVVNKTVEGQLSEVMDEVGRAITQAMSTKINLGKSENLGTLVAEARAGYEEAHLQVLNSMEKAAFEAMAPALSKWGPRIASKMRGAYGDIASGGGKGSGPGVGTDFSGKIAGMLGAGGAGGFTAAAEPLIASITAIINEGNAGKIWPQLQLLAHEPTMHDSLYGALAAFNEKHPEVAIKAKLGFEFPTSGFALPLNKQDLAAQIASAFDEAGKLVQLSGVQVGTGARRARASAGGKAAGSPTDADSGLSPEELWSKYGATRVRPTRKQTDSEREHNDAVKQYETADRNQLRSRASQNPLDLLKEFGGGNPALLQMAQSIKDAKDFTPKTSDEAKLKLEKIKAAEDLLGPFFQQLYDEAKKLASVGDSRGAAGLNYAGVNFKAQTATSVRALSADKDEQASRRAIREAEAAADARQAYSESQKLFSKGLYSDVGGAPLDRYRDRMEAYRRLYELVRNYEREITAYAHARNDDEVSASNKRINAAVRELEIQRDILNSRLLAGNRQTVPLRRTESQWRVDDQGSIYAERSFVKGAKGEDIRDQVTLSKAYASTATVLNETLRPALEHLNMTMRNLQRDELVKGRVAELGGDSGAASAHYARGQGFKELDFPGMLSAIQMGSGAGFDNIAESMAKTMRLTAEEEAIYQKILGADKDVAGAEKYRNELAQGRLKSLIEEVGIYNNRLLPAIAKQRGEIEFLDRYDQMKRNQQQDPNGLKRAARGLSNTFGFYAGGMAIGFMARNEFREAIAYQKSLAEIQGILADKSPSEARKIGDAITSIAMKYGTTFKETADAAKLYAQQGMNATQISKELNSTMMASRGMGIAVSEMNELQAALHAVQDELGQTNKEYITSSALVEKMGALQSNYAVSAKNVADALKTSAPMVKNFTENMRGPTDFVDMTAGITTVMMQKLRISGAQAGTALNTTLARLMRPEVVTKLQTGYGVKLGTTQGTMLPIDQIFGELSKRYNEMKSAGGPSAVKADQMLAQLAGARRVNYLAAVLKNYDEALKASEVSADAFGMAQTRSDLVMDTLGAKVQQTRNAFQLFASDLIENGIVAEGLKGTLEGVAVVLGALAGGAGGYGSGIASVLGIVGATVAVKGVAKGANRLGIARDAYKLGTPYGEALSAISNRTNAELADRLGGGFVRDGALKGLSITGGAAASAEAGAAGGLVGRGLTKLSGVFGGLVSFIGPTGVILLGFTALLALFGLWHRAMNGAGDDTRKYGIRLKTASESGIYESPQYTNLQNTLENLGYKNMQKGISDVRGAMLSPEIQGVPGKYGAGNFIQLLDMARRGQQKDAPEVANQLINSVANSKSLSDEARQKINGISDAGERLAYVTKLVGDMAFAATWQVNQAVEMSKQSIDRQSSDILTGVQHLDVERERTNRFSRLVGSAMDRITNQQVLTQPVAMRIYGASKQTTLDRAHEAIGSFWESAGMPQLQRNGLMNKNSFFIKAMDTTIAAFDNAGKHVVSTGELLSGTFQALKDMKGDVTIEDWNKDKTGHFQKGSHVGTPYDSVIDQMAKASLEGTQFGNELRNMDPSLYKDAGAPSNASAVEDITQIQEKVTARAKELLEGLAAKSGKVVTAQDIKAMADYMNQQRHMFVAMQTGAQFITVFKDKLMDLVLSLSSELHKLDAQDAFASRHGLAFNRPEKNVQLMQQFAEQLDTFSPQMAAEYTKKAVELRNTHATGFNFVPNSTDITGPDGKVIDLSAPDDNGPLQESKNTAKRMAQLRSELDQMGQMYHDMTDGLYELAKSFPSNPISQSILEYLNQNLSKDNGVPVGGLDALKGLSGAVHRGYDTSAEGVYQRKIAVLGGSQGLKSAENTADVGRSALDVEEDMTKKTEGRLEIARQLLGVQLKDLDAQVQRRDMDIDVARYQKQELAGALLLSTEQERQMQLQSAKNDLTKQGLANLKEGVASLTGSIGNLDLYGQIFQTRGIERAGAIHKYVENIYKSVTDPIAKRMSENLNSALSDYLKDFDNIMNVAQSPENKMKGDIQEAGSLVATNWQSSIITAGNEVAATWSAAIKGAAAPGTTPPSTTPTGQGAVGGVVTGVAIQKAGHGLHLLNSRVYPEVPIIGADSLGVTDSTKVHQNPQGAWVYDTASRTSDGKVPTHRLDGVSGRRPGETWEQYEARVLATPLSSYPKSALTPDRRLSSLAPAVQNQFSSLIEEAKKQGINVGVGETARSVTRQELLFHQGRGGDKHSPSTWTLTSNHADGRAVDFTGSQANLARLGKLAVARGFVTVDGDPGHISMPAPASDFAHVLPDVVVNGVRGGNELQAKSDTAMALRDKKYGGSAQGNPFYMNLPKSDEEKLKRLNKETGGIQGWAAAIRSGFRPTPDVSTPEASTVAGSAVPFKSLDFSGFTNLYHDQFPFATSGVANSQVEEKHIIAAAIATGKVKPTGMSSSLPNLPKDGPQVSTTPSDHSNAMALISDSVIKKIQIPTGTKGFWGKYNAHAPTTTGQQVVAGLGSLGGQMLGTGLGGGGQIAQAGSSLGAMGGAVIGQALIPIPGLGAAVGGLVGGALGGLLGGKLDTKPLIDREINHLDSIEFNTRETISAIEQQTDKLRKPDAALFNLPSGFNIPGYSPQFAGGGGGGGVVLASGAVQVSIGGGSNLSSAQIQAAVDRGVTAALNKGRTSTARGNSKY
jgi:hypothetical protein